MTSSKRMMQFSRLIFSALFLVSSSLALSNNTGSNTQLKQENVLNMLILDSLSEIVFPQVDEWSRRTGVKVIKHEMEAELIYFENDFDMRGPHFFDAVMGMSSSLLRQWTTQGLLTDLTQLRQQNITQGMVDWVKEETVAADSRMFPVDGQVVLGYYREDLLERTNLSSPHTWDDVLRIARHFHGKDLNGDGKPDPGLCMDTSISGFGYIGLLSVISAYVQSQGSSQGLYFDTRSMSPLADSPGWKAGMKTYRRLASLTSLGLQGVEETVSESLTRLVEGKCAIGFGPSFFGGFARMNSSLVRSGRIKIVTTPLFGSTEVQTENGFDSASRVMTSCNPSICPFMDDLGVNRPPFFPGGLCFILPNTTRQADAALALNLISFLSSDDLSLQFVNSPGSLIGPYRQVHLDGKWVDSEKGMSVSGKEQLQQYLEVVKSVFTSANKAMDLSLRGSIEYIGINVINPTALEGARKLLLQNISFEYDLEIDQIARSLTRQWNLISDKYDRLVQLNSYRSSLSLPSVQYLEPLGEINTSPTRKGMYVVASVAMACVIILSIWALIHMSHPVMVAAGAHFCRLIIFAGIVASVALFLWVAEPNDPICFLKVIFAHLSCIVILSCISLKNYRLWTVHRKSARLSDVPLSNQTLLGYLAVVITLDAILIAIWCWKSDPRAEWVILRDSNSKVYECVYDHKAEFSITYFVLLAPFLVFSLLVAFLTKDVKSEYNESTTLAVIVYTGILALGILVPIIYVISDRTAQLVIEILGGGVVLVVTFIAFFGSKIYFVYRLPSNDHPRVQATTISAV